MFFFGLTFFIKNQAFVWDTYRKILLSKFSIRLGHFYLAQLHFSLRSDDVICSTYPADCKEVFFKFFMHFDVTSDIS